MYTITLNHLEPSQAVSTWQSFTAQLQVCLNQVPPSSDYWLLNATVPADLVGFPSATFENLTKVYIQVKAGKIAQVVDLSPDVGDALVFDLQGNMVTSCFVDLHTHLDKAHTWTRTPNPDGSFNGALTAIAQDRQFWQATELERRLEFSLKCSYAHGTKAIRTHLDLPTQLIELSLPIFKELKAKWRDRLDLQAAALVELKDWQGVAGEKLADRMAEIGGAIGGLVVPGNNLDSELDRVFDLAEERNLDLDFHTDETDDSKSNGLLKVAEAKLRHQNYSGSIVCGHCCNLSLQDEEEADRIIYLVRQANLNIVSLPTCNLYLQDRQLNQTPRWRGITLLHELKAAGIPVAIAHDNARDPFYSFGDHDLLEIFRMAVQICHLDMPYGNWLSSICQVPAQIMGLDCRLMPGVCADLIIFNARSYSELLARPQSDRLILRQGQPISSILPSYRELEV
jgi:cytosine/creatinine deaminase